MSALTTLGRHDLFTLFDKQSGSVERIGIELEIACVHPTTGRSVSYDGAGGMRALLEGLLSRGIGAPMLHGDILVGVDMGAGGSFTFEHGGAIEYSSPPMASLVELVDDTHALLAQVADIGRAIDVALVPGGNFPFNTMDDVNWMPKPIGTVFRDYFVALGKAGSGAAEMTAHATAVQVTLDYLSSDDLHSKLRTAVALTPIVVALFANSPLVGGRMCGSLSRRTELWLKTDPARCAFIPAALDAEASLGEFVSDFVDWALDIPMIYHRRGDTFESAGRSNFATIMSEGWPDGSPATLDDWRSHLSQIFTDVRLRDTIELRAADGPPAPAIASLPAFWTGILYHEPTCREAWRLMEPFTLAQLQDAHRAAARGGLQAKLGSVPVLALAREMVRLARQGLSSRIDAGLESARAVRYLDPLEEVAATGRTFAEQCLEQWSGPFRESPAAYVDSFRIA